VHGLAGTLVRLECTVCAVRDWEWADKASLIRHANNKNIWRNLLDRFPHPYTEPDAQSWLTFVASVSPRTNWAIDVDGQAVGGIGFDRGHGNHAKTGQFGYWLGESYWGRGIISAAVRATVEYVFSRDDVARLEASVFEWNPASMRVLEKCGFVREGLLRASVFKDGQLIDTVLYARIRL
jgi:ribosomal-protein-alanine N-acetyltransferase